jgi:hypothetical protein
MNLPNVMHKEKSMPTPDELQCFCHPKHERILNDHDKSFAETKVELSSVWKAIEQRPTNKYFIILVLLVLSNLAFQWGIYEKVATLATRVAIVDVKLDAHRQLTLKNQQFDFKQEKKTGE